MITLSGVFLIETVVYLFDVMDVTLAVRVDDLQAVTSGVGQSVDANLE